MNLEREAPVPLYIQLIDTLASEIAAGGYTPDQRLMSERELCQRFKVSRMTVRQALSRLERDGLVYTRVGKGTFVREQKIKQQLSTLTGFSQEVQNRGGEPKSRVLEAKIIPADLKIAKILNLERGHEVVMISRLRIANNIPLSIESAHIPHALCPNILEHDFAVESLYHVFEHKYGLHLVGAEQSMIARLALPDELELLQLTPPAAVMSMERVTHTDRDVIVEYVVSTTRGDLYMFHSRLQPYPN